MFANPLRSCQARRPERPTFKPVLEALERREVPTCAQTVAAFHALPTDVNNLQSALSSTNVNSINANTNTVAGTMFQLVAGAPGFQVPSRLTIDTALIVEGINLIVIGIENFPHIPIPQFENVVQLGSTAFRDGFNDLLFTGFFPGTSGNCILT